jgi:large subunit ribosomal protein L17
MHKRIKTTLAKAKALRKYVEPLINRSKDDTTHSRRIVFSYLQNKEAVTELFREISKKIGNRPGGYTRILKLGNRVGDAAEICYIELVDYNQNMLTDVTDSKKKSTRRSRRKKTDETVPKTVEAPKVKTEAKVKEIVKAAEEVVEKTEVAPTEETVTEDKVETDISQETEEGKPASE